MITRISLHHYKLGYNGIFLIINGDFQLVPA